MYKSDLHYIYIARRAMAMHSTTSTHTKQVANLKHNAYNGN